LKVTYRRHIFVMINDKFDNINKIASGAIVFSLSTSKC